MPYDPTVDEAQDPGIPAASTTPQVIQVPGSRPTVSSSGATAAISNNLNTVSYPAPKAPDVIQNVRTIATDTNITTVDNLLIVTATANLTLPLASTMQGIPIQIQCAVSGATVTVLPTLGDLINGYTSVVFTNKNSLFGFVSTGHTWVIF